MQICPMLIKLFDITEIILVGSDVENWLNLQNMSTSINIHYINAKQYNLTSFNIPKNWSIYTELLHTDQNTVAFHKLNNHQLNGTLSHHTLNNLWPNLKTVETLKLNTVSLDDFVKNNTSQDSHKMLVIDTFDTLSFIEELPYIDIIMTRVIDDDAQVFKEYSKDQIDKKLLDYGYKNVATFEDNHPKIKMLVYSKDDENRENTLNELVTAKTELENKLITLQNRLKQEEISKNELEKEIMSFKNNLEEEKLSKNKIQNDYTNIITKISNKIDTSSQNVIRQLEAYIGIQKYVDMPLNLHGWPISPDIALFMAQQIEMNEYDLILEFGSGTSTLLFASIVKNLKEKNDRKTKVIALDHHEKYYTQTKDQLDAYKLNKFAKVKHAPLITYIDLKDKYKYYDCEAVFEQLALKEKYNKIFVLVDGPPGATGPLARVPALSHLLKFFSNKEIHLVLDDYHRDEEQTIANKWEDILEKKNIEFDSETITSEKGLYFLKINTHKVLK